jgi:hypothetical protein
MMNILEKEDLIKGLPDNVLQQQMQAPTGELPQYLLISEIQRRTDMRKSLQEQPKQESIADQIRMEGIMATRPQMQPQMPMPQPQMPMPPMPMEQPPMGMAQGGVVRMANGGVPPSKEELRKMYPEYTEEQIQAIFESKIMPDGNVFSRTLDKITGTADAFGSEYQRIRDEAEKGGFAGGAGAATIAPFRLAAKGIGALGERAYDAPLTQLGIAAVKGIPEFVGGVTGLSELSMDDLSYLPAALGADPNTVGLSDAVLERRKKLLQEINIDDITKLKRAGSKAQVTGVDDQTLQSVPQVLDINDRTEADKVIDVDTDVATDTGTADVAGGIASTGSGTPSVTDSGGLIERILGLVDKPSEAVSYADLIEQSRGRAKGEALTQLGLGIMGGSLQKGLSGASKAVSAARDAESKLSLQERIAQRDALNKDKSRDIQALSAAARIQQSAEASAARLDQYEKSLKRAMINQNALNWRHINTMARQMSEAAVKEITDSTIPKLPEGFKSIEDYRIYMFNLYKKKFTDEMPPLDDEDVSADLPGVSGRQPMKMINRTN